MDIASRLYCLRQLGGLAWRNLYHGFRGIYRRSGSPLPADHDARLYYPFRDPARGLGGRSDRTRRSHGSG